MRQDDMIYNMARQNNLLDRLRQAERLNDRLLQRDTVANSLSEISAELGEVGGGRLVDAYMDYIGDAGTTNLVYNGDFAITAAGLYGYKYSAGAYDNWSQFSNKAQSTQLTIPAGSYTEWIKTYLIRVDGGFDYTHAITGVVTQAAGTMTITASSAEVRWYTKYLPGYGSTLIRTDVIGAWAIGTATLTATLTAPINAYYAEIYEGITYTASATPNGFYITFDDITLIPVNEGYRLSYTPDIDYSRGMWPTQQAINPGTMRMFNASDVAVTQYDRTINSSAIGNCYWGAPTANCNDGDYYVVEFPLAKGTYSINLYYVSSGTSGKVNIWLDGQLQSKEADLYSGSANYDNLISLTSIVVGYSGIHELRFVVVGKNGSASDYRFLPSLIMIL